MMFEQIILQPLSDFIGFLYTTAYQISGNYGISIILLSLMVSIIIYPLQKVSDRLKEKDDREKEVINPLLIDIKKNYIGAERYYYIRYLNRLNSYHPIKAMRSLGGLLIQIPFFMGAYHFLGHYEPLNGVEFLIFQDLGRPDSLIIGFNILPIVMTGVNILASSILMNGKPFKEKIQLYLIALLFLILLYYSPSGLVLYWTFNNLFSLLKIIVMKTVKKEQLIDLSPLKKLRSPSLWVPVLILMISIAIIFVSIPMKNKSIRYMGYAILSGLVLFYFFLYLRTFNNDKHNRAIIFLFVILFLFIPIAWKVHHIFSMLVILSMLMLTLLTRSRYNEFYRRNYFIEKPVKEKAIGIIAPIILSFLFFLFAPVAFVSSDPLAIEGFVSILTDYYFPAWIISSFLMSGLYLLLPTKISRFYLFGIIAAILIFTVHGYFLPGSYDQMEGMAFAKLRISTKREVIDIGIYGLMVFFTILLFSKKYQSKRLPVISIIFIVGFSFFMINTIKIVHAVDEYERSMTKSAERTSVYSFSKQKQNVVVIMLDRAFGFMIKDVFSYDEQLRHDFDGFTAYPNCISSSNATIGGFLPIVGGYEYTVDKIQQRDSESLIEKALEAFSVIPRNLEGNNYDILYSNIDYAPGVMTSELLESLGVSVNNDGNRYVLSDSDRVNKAMILLGGGLFRLAGDLFRMDIYRGGTWLTEDPDMSPEYGVARKYHSQLDMLPQASRAHSKKNNYILIHNLMIHNPYVYGSEGEMFKDARINDGVLSRYPKEDVDKFEDQYSLVHFYGMKTSLQLLAKWFEWMKENDVYDNTKIIIVSDHGRDLKWSGDLQPNRIGPGKVQKTFFVPLFMVKDFNSNGDVKIDYEFMTNADVPSIVLSHLGGGVNPVNKKPLPVEKKKPIDIYFINYKLKDTYRKVYDVYSKAQLINQNIYKDSNWLLIDED